MASGALIDIGPAITKSGAVYRGTRDRSGVTAGPPKTSSQPRVTTTTRVPQPAPTQAVAPTPAPAAQVPTPDVAAGGAGEVGGIDIAAIEAAIAAIEAQFGLTREQLLADESEIGRSYRLLIAQAERARTESVEDVFNAGAERGIARSGITASAAADVERMAAELIGDLQSQQAAQEGAIQTQLAQEQNAAAAAKLTAAQQHGAQVLTQEELEALINAGLA